MIAADTPPAARMETISKNLSDWCARRNGEREFRVTLLEITGASGWG